MKSQIKTGITIAVIVTALLFFYLQPEKQSDNTAPTNQQLIEAYHNKRSDIVLTGTGVVKKILKDDLKGSRHQRFIVKISQTQTILIAHNIDLAPRVKNLQTGDLVEFKGEYEWNSKGGVVHWTHLDPRGKHPHGWIKHNNEIYQ